MDNEPKTKEDWILLADRLAGHLLSMHDWVDGLYQAYGITPNRSCQRWVDEGRDLAEGTIARTEEIFRELDKAALTPRGG